MTCSLNRIAFIAILSAAAALAAARAQAQDGLSFTLGLGVSSGPDYVGADSYGVGLSRKISLKRFSLGPLSFGPPDDGSERLGFGLRGAFRTVGARSAENNPELAGLNDVRSSVEIGFGLGYEAEDWRAFAALRHGIIGHDGVVAELGADWKAVTGPRLNLSIGPRLFYGSGAYTRTYFGVTADEALASGLPAFTPDAGLVSAGIAIGATYALGGDWALEGSLTLDRLQGDAAASPITGLGARDQASVGVTLTRRFSLGF